MTDAYPYPAVRHVLKMHADSMGVYMLANSLKSQQADLDAAHAANLAIERNAGQLLVDVITELVTVGDGQHNRVNDANLVIVLGMYEKAFPLMLGHPHALGLFGTPHMSFLNVFFRYRRDPSPLSAGYLLCTAMEYTFSTRADTPDNPISYAQYVEIGTAIDGNPFMSAEKFCAGNTVSGSMFRAVVRAYQDTWNAAIAEPSIQALVEGREIPTRTHDLVFRSSFAASLLDPDAGVVEGAASAIARLKVGD